MTGKARKRQHIAAMPSFHGRPGRFRPNPIGEAALGVWPVARGARKHGAFLPPFPRTQSARADNPRTQISPRMDCALTNTPMPTMRTPNTTLPSATVHVLMPFDQRAHLPGMARAKAIGSQMVEVATRMKAAKYASAIEGLASGPFGRGCRRRRNGAAARNVEYPHEADSPGDPGATKRGPLFPGALLPSPPNSDAQPIARYVLRFGCVARNAAVLGCSNLRASGLGQDQRSDVTTSHAESPPLRRRERYCALGVLRATGHSEEHAELRAIEARNGRRCPGASRVVEENTTARTPRRPRRIRRGLRA